MRVTAIVNSSYSIILIDPLQVAVDIDYARSMYDLHKKVNANEMIVGWSVLFTKNIHLNLNLKLNLKHVQ